MNTNDFDQLLKDKFGEHEFAYKEASWQMLTQQLPPSRRKTIPLPWLKVSGIAASVAIVVGAAGWYYSADKQSGIVVAQPSVAATSTQAQPTAQNNTEASEQPPSKNVNIASANLNKTNRANFIANKKATASDNTITFPIVAQSNNNTVAQPAQQKLQESVTTQEPRVAQNNNSTESAPKVWQGRQNYPDFTPDEPKLSPKPGKTLFSLTGGMNYGSLNTGYAAGVNARRKLGNRVFVEGDLAFVNNTASQTLDQMPAPTPVGSSKAPLDYKTASLYYVQFNPTVGYQVLKNVSLGVGADVQRMLNGDNTLVDINDEIKTIPGTDVGLTGKTEVSLSRKLKAGVLYREGINNVINSGGNYFDRRYMQVQLKFTLLGK